MNHFCLTCFSLPLDSALYVGKQHSDTVNDEFISSYQLWPTLGYCWRGIAVSLWAQDCRGGGWGALPRPGATGGGEGNHRLGERLWVYQKSSLATRDRIDAINGAPLFSHHEAVKQRAVTEGGKEEEGPGYAGYLNGCKVSEGWTADEFLLLTLASFSCPDSVLKNIVTFFTFWHFVMS